MGSKDEKEGATSYHISFCSIMFQVAEKKML